MEVWAMRLDTPLTEREEQALLERLPVTLREELSRRKQAVHRQQSLCAYALLARIVEALGFSPLPEICRAEGGKPFFPEHPDVHFSISHTEGVVLAALSREAVGADVQKVRPVSDRMLSLLPEEETDFFTAWVRWEACAKWAGSSVFAQLRGERQMTVPCKNVDTYPGYCAAVAGNEDLDRICVEFCTLRELFYDRSL